MRPLIAILLAADLIELTGRIEPAPPQAFVTLSGAGIPFMASVVTGPDGRFRFRGLAPGAYTLSVLAPGRGEVWRTVHLHGGAPGGRTSLVVPFEPPPGTLAEGHTVGLETLRLPGRAIRHYRRALDALGRYDAEAARRQLLRAVELAPRFSAAWNQLGTIAYQSGRREEAEKYFREALRHEPSAYSPLVNLGGVLVNLGRYLEAREVNREAVRRQPADALARVQLGAACWALGDSEEAIVHLREAIRLDPDHFSSPHLLLAEVYAARSEHEAAAAVLEEFLSRRPNAPEASRVRRRLEELKRAPPAQP
ncbi:MAG: tetratricopeptide repeat protein [Bryobacterales bacterium]|nr:tetratricopeptide repeat protein [Bryobacterales bacterium]